MLQRGRPSAASKLDRPLNAMAERPEPPAELSEPEKELWRQVVASRRPQWFAGSESLLRSYVLSTIHCQQLESQLRTMEPSAEARYQRLAKLHRFSVTQCMALARTLRLTVSSRIDQHVRHDGDAPLMLHDHDPGPSIPRLRAVSKAGTERRFSDLLAESHRRRGRTIAVASLAARELADCACIQGRGNDEEGGAED